MVLLKHTDKSISKVNVNKDVMKELFESSKINKDVELVFISRVVNTPTEKDKSDLKDLCTEYKIDVDPLNRRFTRNKIFIREKNLEEAFKKWAILSTRFNS